MATVLGGVQPHRAMRCPWRNDAKIRIESAQAQTFAGPFLRNLWFLERFGSGNHTIK